MDYGVRSAPACVLHFWVGGEVAAMWRFGTDADVAVRDQAVRAGGGSRGVLMVPLYSARPMGACISFLYELGGWEPRAGRRIVLSHASDEGRFAGGEVAGCEYSRIFSLDRWIVSFRLGN